MALHNTENLTTTATLQKVINEQDKLVSKGLQRAGYYVWLHTDPATDVTVEELKALAAFSKLDLGDVIPDSPVKPRAAFTWARERAESGSGAKFYNVDKATMSETWALQPQAEITEALDSMQRRADLDAVVLRVMFMADDADLTTPGHPDYDATLSPTASNPNVCGDDESHEVFVALRSAWERRRTTLLKPDLTNMAGKALYAMERIPGKQEGGVYFVREGFAEQARALREVFSNLHRSTAPEPFDADESTPSYVRLTSVFNDDDSIASLKQEARLGFESNLKKLRAEVEGFKSKSASDSTLNSALEKAKELLGDLALYEDVCSMLAEDLKSDAESMRQTVQVMLDGDDN